MTPAYEVLRKIGRCANGAERDKGHIYHAVRKGGWTALCGAEPGRTSAGWSHWNDPEQAVTCPRCKKKIAVPPGDHDEPR
jgi:hypothetical protein